VRIAQGAPISQRRGSLKKGVEKRFELSWARSVWLDGAPSGPKSEVARQLHRGVDKLRLTHPGAALDQDGPPGSRADLAEPVFDDGQL
jgi:hypothetical protein